MNELYSPHSLSQFADRAKLNAEPYRVAVPFPHIVLDDFLPGEVLEEVLRDFPATGQLDWAGFDNPHEKKLAFYNAEAMPPSIRDTLHFLNSRVTLEFLEHLTGITGLLPDPYFVGGGLHQIERGGYLGVHADFNRYERFSLRRRLNLLLYLNKGWREEYGGHLELWDQTMTRSVLRVLPVFNRCVIFNTTDTAFHGHPSPLTCPGDRARKSLATYYYSNEHLDGDGPGHSTLFQRRPGLDSNVTSSAAQRAKRIVSSIVPPILLDAARCVRKLLR